jgi:hypothetical protein
MSKKPDKSSSVGSCERCGRPVVFDKFTLCYECRGDEKAEVQKALDYLKSHPGATLQTVADATGVNPQMVLKLIRHGRMEVQGKKKK